MGKKVERQIKVALERQSDNLIHQVNVVLTENNAKLQAGFDILEAKIDDLERQVSDIAMVHGDLLKRTQDLERHRHLRPVGEEAHEPLSGEPQVDSEFLPRPTYRRGKR